MESDTSFYKAGLSSISAMKLCILISEEFGVTVKTSDIHENNTVEKLEKYVMLAPKIRTYEKREVYPLTGSQKGIFAECSKNPESTVYNIPFLFELETLWTYRSYPMQLPDGRCTFRICSQRFILSDMGRWCSALRKKTFVPEVIRDHK
ncbi:acyl carrier protein [Blautia sp.]|uniref:acyl carrier protein n=1 Tax=Blautia sp. TaxID=1955243 RepID=UPI003520F17D